VIERELIILTFVASAFGYVNIEYIFIHPVHIDSTSWSCLGIFLASLARTQTDKSASMIDIVSGNYIETGVSWRSTSTSLCLPLNENTLALICHSLP